MRLFGLIGCFAAGAAMTVPAAASYELSLIYDSENRQILRYDPVSNRAMGAFGEGSLGVFANAVRLSTDPTRPGQVAALAVTGMVRWFDFSTGIATDTIDLAPNPDGRIFAQSMQIMGDGRLLVMNNSGLATVYNRNGTEALSLAQYAGYTTMDAMPLAGGRFLTLERTQSGSTFNYHLFNRSADGLFSFALIGWRSSSSSTAYRRLATNGQIVYATGLESSSLRIAAARLQSLSFLNVNIETYGSASGLLSNASFLHQGQAYLVGRRTSDNVNVRYRIDQTDGSAFQDVTMPYAQPLGDIVTVVAPEPGTMLALGAGLAALVRRRRRARN